MESCGWSAPSHGASVFKNPERLNPDRPRAKESLLRFEKRNLLWGIFCLALVGGLSCAQTRDSDQRESPEAATGWSYSPVTAERLLDPEPENWLMYRRTYDSHGYSPLDQIDTKNVKRLIPA